MIHILHHIFPNELGKKIAKEQFERIEKKIKKPYNYIENNVGLSGNELNTYKLLIQNCLNSFELDDVVLFIHTKGATRDNLIKREWREYLERELIDDYEYHIDKLYLGFDTSGVLMGIPHWSENFYPGNFWWAKVDFLNKIDKKCEWRMENRWYAENGFFHSIKKWNPFSKPTTNFDKLDNFYMYIKDQELLFNKIEKTRLI
jgi:hypothetical protein